MKSSSLLGIPLLIIYATAGAFILAFVSYFYGKYSEAISGRRRDRGGANVANDVWMLGLLSCDFGPSPYTNGPARSLPFPKESERLALRIGPHD
jgi:hypothetical protein